MFFFSKTNCQYNHTQGCWFSTYVHIIVWYHIVLYRNSNTNRTHFEQKQLRTGVSKYYIGPVGQLTVSRPCRLALHQPCQPRGRVLTLTDPRGRHFFENWHYPILLTLSNARGGVLTLTDARGEVVSLFHQRGEVLTLADVVFTRTVDEVLAWMKANRLQLNPAKTEVFWCASSRRQHQILTVPVRVGDALVSPVTAARDLGVYIDASITMRTQVINTIRVCFAALRQIRSVRRSLPQHALLTLIRTLDTGHHQVGSV